MSNLRQAAQMLVEACEQRLPLVGQANIIDELNSVRAALAEPEQEPVAWVFVDDTGMKFVSVDRPHKDFQPLYTAPTPRKPQPLTDAEILSVMRLSPPEPSLWPHLKDEAAVGDVQRGIIAIARAIERAHGIGEQHE